MSEPRFNSFSEFWPFYVTEHSKPATRLLHLVGTTAGICCVVFFIAAGKSGNLRVSVVVFHRRLQDDRVNADRKDE